MAVDNEGWKQKPVFSGLGVLIHQPMRLLMQKAKKVCGKYEVGFS